MAECQCLLHHAWYEHSLNAADAKNMEAAIAYLYCTCTALCCSDSSSQSAKRCLALARLTRAETVRQAQIRAAALTNVYVLVNEVNQCHRV